MSLYLDSANIEEARIAHNSGMVVGITTNPSLIAREGKPAEDIIYELAQESAECVFYQLIGATIEDKLAEAYRFSALSPGKVGLKIPCTYENLPIAARLARDGHLVGITAVFSLAQSYLAVQSGVNYILPYVNRITRLQGDGIGFVRGIRSVIDASASDTRILAASIKTPDEAVNVHLAGAHHLTLPLEVIQAMGNHRLSDLAIDEFNQVMTGKF